MRERERERKRASVYTRESRERGSGDDDDDGGSGGERREREDGGNLSVTRRAREHTHTPMSPRERTNARASGERGSREGERRGGEYVLHKETPYVAAAARSYAKRKTERYIPIYTRAKVCPVCAHCTFSRENAIAVARARILECLHVCM